MNAAAPAPTVPCFERACSIIAISGGILVVLVGVLVCISVISRKLLHSPIPGDFEFVQMATGLAVFSFLPLAQARRVNIVVDTLSSGWSARTLARVDALWDLVYALMMAVIGYCMINGSLEAIATHTTSMVLQLPIWPAIAACTALCLMLAAVCLLTAARLLKALR